MDKKSIRENIETLICDDNNVEFMSFLRSQACNFSPNELLKLICMHRAVGCATSLLEENSGFCVDVNASLDGGSFPLQLAAGSLSFGLTSILLKHGAQVNVCNESGSNDLTMLPLYMALKAVSDHQCLIDWCLGKSIFKLLYIFCLQDLKEPLETIRLLANRTEDVEKVSLYCVEHGEVIRLAALLMCAWDKLVPPNVEDVERSLVGEHIWGQIDVILNQELQFMINCGPDCQVLEPLKSKKVNLLAQWKFLKVLDIARDVIEEYCTSWLFEDLENYEVPYELACQLSEETELVFKPDDVYCDDIKCLTPKLNTIEKAMLNEDIEKQLQLWSISPGPTTREADGSEVRLQKKSFIKPMVSSAVVRPTGGRCCSLLSSTSFCSSRSYHTWRDLGRPAEIRVPKPPLKIARPPLSMVSSSTKICARFLLCAKKIMK